MTPIVVSVVIPVFNKFDLTRDCLESLKRYAPDLAMEVVVVDNGSTDATVAELEPLGRNLFQERFHRIRHETNRNFGPACNAGALEARGEFVFFLNNDTLLTPGWFAPLVHGLDDGCGAVGPLLMYPEDETLLSDRVQHLGVCCEPQCLLCHLYEHFPVSHPVVGKKRSLQFLTGAALFMRRSVFHEVGMLHEGYVNGAEDLDLCVRLRRKGYTLSSAPESRIYHLQSQTPGRHDHEADNAALFKERCMAHIFPDLHLHLKTDGYELALNEHLISYARLPRRRSELMEKAFFRNTTTPDAETCEAMLLREPLFFPAYERLAAIYEDDENYESLTRLRFLQTRLFPSPAAGALLREAAAKAGNEAMEQEGERLVVTATQLGDHEELAAIATEMVQFGEQLRQPVISDLYSDWLHSQPGREGDS